MTADTAARVIVCTIPVDDEDIEVTLQAMTRKQWSHLVAAHPSTNPAHRWDSVTFDPALVQACIVDPVIDDALAIRLLEDPDLGDDLLLHCFTLCAPLSLSGVKERLRRDTRLLAEVDAATEIGISHDAFLDWPEESQDLVLARREMKSQVCPGCGVPEEDMGVDTRWEARTVSCWHCNELHEERELIPDHQAHYTHAHLIKPDYAMGS